MLKHLEIEFRDNVQSSQQQYKEIISQLDNEVQQLKRDVVEKSVTREELELLLNRIATREELQILKNRIAILEKGQQQSMQVAKLTLSEPLDPPPAIGARRSEYSSRPGVSFRRQSLEKKDMQKRWSLPAMFANDDYTNEADFGAGNDRKRLPSVSSTDSGKSSMLPTPDDTQKSFDFSKSEFYPKLKRSRSATTKRLLYRDISQDGDLV